MLKDALFGQERVEGRLASLFINQGGAFAKSSCRAVILDIPRPTFKTPPRWRDFEVTFPSILTGAWMITKC